MGYEHIAAEVKEGVGTVVLDRPPLNILNMAMMQEINQALQDFSNQGIKLLVFKAEGKGFSGGVDVGEHMGDMAPKMIDVFHAMFRNMDKLGVPSIAVVNGAALGGGCELAVYCDLVIASEKSKFGQPEIQVGVFPPIAALIFPRIMGRKKAMELLLSGDVIPAEEAKDLGLVNTVVAPEDLAAEAEKFIGKFKKMSGVVMKHTKEAALTGLQEDEEKSLAGIEDLYLNRLMQTHDANEGLKAFMEKRKPEWKES
ncbi:MAG: enoyl-CoA hydratase/isomerase family protein [Desulfohalobiaceae bacterium]|nr:enoyl-CoA hydratase/isomerase family protein [Desulfohalobiaceae bacterium]